MEIIKEIIDDEQNDVIIVEDLFSENKRDIPVSKKISSNFEKGDLVEWKSSYETEMKQ